MFNIPDFGANAYCPLPREIYYYPASNPARMIFDGYAETQRNYIDERVWAGLAEEFERKKEVGDV